MSKDKNTSKSDIVIPSKRQTQYFAVKLEKHFDQIEVSIPQKQIFSQELIIRLTDHIKKI